MTELIIDKKKNLVTIQDGGYDAERFDWKVLYLNRIDFTLGDILYEVEKHFPPDEYFGNETQYVIKSIWGKPDKKRKTIEIAGFPCRASFIPSIYEIFKEDDTLVLSINDIEDIRLTFGVKGVEFYPLNMSDYSAGMRFRVNRLLDVIYGLLFYCAYNKLKLKKCVHCDRWFVTQTLEIDYCERNSPLTIGKYSTMRCKDAAETFKKRLRAREKSIIKSWNNQKESKDAQRAFDLTNTRNDYLKSKPLSVKNLLWLYEYLYSEQMPKRIRASTKTNDQRQ